MDTKTAVYLALKDLENFFELHGVPAWKTRTQSAIQKLENNTAEVKTILHDFVGAGMGSLIDLSVSEANGNLLLKSEEETNQELEILTVKLLQLKSALDKRS